jgi:hypothetical protein
MRRSDCVRYNPFTKRYSRVGPVNEERYLALMGFLKAIKNLEKYLTFTNNDMGSPDDCSEIEGSNKDIKLSLKSFLCLIWISLNVYGHV